MVLTMHSYHYPGVTNNLYIAPSTFEKLAAHWNVSGSVPEHRQLNDE